MQRLFQSRRFRQRKRVWATGRRGQLTQLTEEVIESSIFGHAAVGKKRLNVVERKHTCHLMFDSSNRMAWELFPARAHFLLESL
jgi:hypothetical protein